MSKLFCGIDVGTTNLKVLLLDEAGTTVWVKSVPAPHLNDGIGVVTDATALVARVEDLILEGWRAAGNGRKIAAISSGGIGEDGVATDANLRPLGHAIQWNDKRGEPHIEQLKATRLVKTNPAIVLDFSSTVGKWQWLWKHKPEEIAGAHHWGTMTDYPLAVWSHTAFIAGTLAPRTGGYDVFTRKWMGDFLQFCKAPPLPPIKLAGEIIGTMKAGALTSAGATDANTLLIAGGHDHPVAASAIRRIDKNARIDSLGTASATYGETETLTLQQRLDGLYVTSPISGSKGAALIGMTEFSVTIANHHGDAGKIYQQLLNTKTIHDIPAPIRKTLETLTRRTKDYWQTMKSAGVPHAPIYATGGWARSPALMQLRANIFGEAITVVDEPELVALGAALFAAQGAGYHPTFSAAKNSHAVQPE